MFGRSLSLDDWKPRQLEAMKVGGNTRAKRFFEEHDIMKTTPLRSHTHILRSHNETNGESDVLQL
jgi:hypothetical protein